MMHHEPFGDARDPRLAEALRDRLEAGGHDEFVSRVMGLVVTRVSPWEELARWARPGVAAAVLLLSAIGLWEALRAEPEAAPADSAQVAGMEMDSDAIVGLALGGPE
jgi:hypothetical protein